MFDNRYYVIFDTIEINVINFNEVMETSSDTLRYSLDGTKTFIKYDGEQPAFLANLTTANGPYTHVEILAILATEEWSEPFTDPRE